MEKKETLQILLSTMFREDLGFLENIFPHKHFSEYNIVIVNQTTPDKILESKYDSIIVINSFERGTSQSRNIAIKYSTADICLIADDDIIYEPDFEETILNTFSNHMDAGIISFEAIIENRKPYKQYPDYTLHNKRTLFSVHEITISFRRKQLIDNQLFFNEYFSLGGLFGGCTEYVFLRAAHAKGIKSYHVPKVIVYHDDFSSGKRMGEDRAIHAASAMCNHFHGNVLSFLWVFKYVFFLYRHRYIKFDELYHKLKIGLKGIKEYSKLVKEQKLMRHID